MSTEEVAAKIKVWGDKSQLLMAEARKVVSEADYNEKTMDDRVAKAGYETVNIMGKFFEGSGSSLISGAIGMIGGAISDRRNYKNQLKLMEQQQDRKSVV